MQPLLLALMAEGNQRAEFWNRKGSPSRSSTAPSRRLISIPSAFRREDGSFAIVDEALALAHRLEIVAQSRPRL
jgi:hypothetical protein